MKKSEISISFLIPTYNDESTIAGVINETLTIAKRNTNKFEIVVIDDASGDQTPQILTALKKKNPPVRIITHPINKGYGQTIRELYYAGKYDWLFTLPGDGQVRASQLPKLLPKTKLANYILGWRTVRHDSAKRKQQSRVYNWLVTHLFDLKIHDVNSVRLVRREIIQQISLSTTSAFVDAELTIKAKRALAIIIEVPIAHSARIHDGATGGKWNVIWPTFKDLMSFYFRYA